MARSAKRGASPKAGVADPADLGGRTEPARAKKARGPAARETTNNPSTLASKSKTAVPKPRTAGKASKIPATQRKASQSKRAKPKAGASGPGLPAAPAIASNETERDLIIADLQRELTAARTRIAELERRQDVVVNRIDWILDTLRTATEPVVRRKPRIARKAR